MASLYLHIPFCEHKCPYCDFYSITDRTQQGAFVRALLKEIELTPAEFRAESVESIFLGGGTPSLLTEHELHAIMQTLRDRFDILPDAEITLEANPGTIDVHILRMFRGAGINRLSLGIQSFHDDELQFLGRIHNAAQGRDAITQGREAGFENLSIDLIYSLPGQTLERWAASLAEAIRNGPNHISAYTLIVEERTPLHALVKAGNVVPNGQDVEAELYQYAMSTFRENGFEQYEVSNYAKPGYRSLHNANYWRHENYIGWGPSAHSFWKTAEGRGGRRWANTASLGEYLHRLSHGQLPPRTEEHLREREMTNEMIFLGLRSNGLDLGRLRKVLDVDLLSTRSAVMQQIMDEHLAVLENGVLRLTSGGYLLCDEIATRMMFT